MNRTNMPMGAFTGEHPFVRLVGVDIDGVLRSKLVKPSKVKEVLENSTGIGFCGVIFSWDMHDLLYISDELQALASQGYPDLIMKVDGQAGYKLAFENDMPMFFVDFYQSELEPFRFCPRSILKNSIAELKALGFKAICGVELEWYNFRETPQSLVSKSFSNLDYLSPSSTAYSAHGHASFRDYYRDIVECARETGIDIESFHMEAGPAVLEAALSHSTALEISDKATLFKTMAKSVAIKHGFIASFMAKLEEGFPGNGGHVHLSLLDSETGENVFWSKSDDSQEQMSELMKHFMGGLLEALPDLMAFFAPTVNSYKRLDKRYWAPVLAAWGIDNRLTALRVVKGEEDGKAMRVEVRVGGADMNMYLAIAAMITAGVYGIKNKSSLLPMTSSDKTNGDAELPKTLEEAIHRMSSQKSLARRLFGDDVINHFVMTRRHEIALYNRHVSDWERRRYLEKS